MGHTIAHAHRRARPRIELQIVATCAARGVADQNAPSQVNRLARDAMRLSWPVARANFDHLAIAITRPDPCWYVRWIVAQNVRPG
jgi:hypothetical protein